MQAIASISADPEFFARVERVRRAGEAGLKTAAYLRTLLLEAVVAREKITAVIPPRPTKPVRSKGVEKWEWDLMLETFKKEDAEWVEKYGAKSEEIFQKRERMTP